MRTAILLMIMLITCLHLIAQDMITMKNGETIRSKVMEVTPNEITYKQKGRTFTIKKSDIVMIRYKGGRTEYFTDKTNENKENNGTAKADTLLRGNDSVMAERGKEDAKLYYKKYKTAEQWTITTTWLTSPVVSLIPAIACSTTPPKDKNLGCPHPELLNNTAYGDA